MRKTKETLPALSESDFQKQIVDLAHLYGYAVAHFRAARTAQGWRTACQFDAEGYPDLTCVNPIQKRVLFVELKARGKKLSPEQEKWRDMLLAAGAEWYTWQPQDFDQAQRIFAALTPAGGEEERK